MTLPNTFSPSKSVECQSVNAITKISSSLPIDILTK